MKNKIDNYVFCEKCEASPCECLNIENKELGLDDTDPRDVDIRLRGISEQFKKNE